MRARATCNTAHGMRVFVWRKPHNARRFPTMPLQEGRRTERVGLTLTAEEVAKIDDYGFARRIRARSEVIRSLALRMLDQETECLNLNRISCIVLTMIVFGSS